MDDLGKTIKGIQKALDDLSKPKAKKAKIRASDGEVFELEMQ